MYSFLATHSMMRYCPCVDKGSLLNATVWKLFEKAGFNTEPNSQSPAEREVKLSATKKRPVDLYAIVPALGVTIVGSNKSGQLKGSWTGHVNDCAEIGRKAKATKVLIVLTGKDVPRENREYALEKGIVVWGEEELAYYEAVAEAIKTYAKYEIIHALGIKTKEEKDTHRVLAVRFRQPTSRANQELFMFTITPERLLKTSVIYRRAQGNARAYQRMLRKNRLPNIRKFISKPEAILPTNIIVNLSDRVTVDEVKEEEFSDIAGRPITLSSPNACDLVVLNIPMEYASIELIDGQHRLYGFAEADAATRLEFNLPVLGVKGLDLIKQGDTFVSINDNVRRMDPNLVSYLKYTEDDAACQKDSELMAIRLVVELSKTTPFNKSIRLLDFGKQTITLKGFSGYDLRGLISPKGLLRQFYPNNKSDEYVQVLRMYFSIIKSLFETEWSDSNRYIVATNRGISAFLKLLKSILKTTNGPLNQQEVNKYLKALNSGWGTWEFEKLRSTYVGAQGWKQFHHHLVETVQREYPDFKE